MSGCSHSKRVADTVIAIEQRLATIKKNLEDKIIDIPIKTMIIHYPITFGAFFKGLGLLEKTNMIGDYQVSIQNIRHFKTLIRKVVPNTQSKNLHLTFHGA